MRSKLCADLPSITWRFVTAMAKGEPHHWTSLGGDAQKGDLTIMFDGPRVDPTYDPMRKQGAILLGNGGDNSNGSQGTFYEGVMTAGAFPTRRHRPAGAGQHRGRQVRRAAAEPGAGLGDRHAAGTPDVRAGLLAGHHRDVHEHHRRARGGREAEHLRAAGSGPPSLRHQRHVATFADPVAPGASVSATFKVTSGRRPSTAT